MIPISVQEKIDSILPGADYPATVMKPLMQAIAEAAFGGVAPEPVEGPLIESGLLDAQFVSSDHSLSIDIQGGLYFLFETYLVVNLRITVPTIDPVFEDEFIVDLLKVSGEESVAIREGYFIDRDTFFQIMNEEIEHIQASVRNVSGEPTQIRISVNNPAGVNSTIQVQAVLILKPIEE
jgi:hypothetical protein